MGSNIRVEVSKNIPKLKFLWKGFSPWVAYASVIRTKGRVRYSASGKTAAEVEDSA